MLTQKNNDKVGIGLFIMLLCFCQLLITVTVHLYFFIKSNGEVDALKRMFMSIVSIVISFLIYAFLDKWISNWLY